MKKDIHQKMKIQSFKKVKGAGSCPLPHPQLASTGIL